MIFMTLVLFLFCKKILLFRFVTVFDVISQLSLNNVLGFLISHSFLNKSSLVFNFLRLRHQIIGYRDFRILKLFVFLYIMSY